MNKKIRTPFASFLLILVSVLVSKSTYSQSLEFFEESLLFELNDDYFSVDGQYYFRNTGQKQLNQVLFYPFPAGEGSEPVDSVYVTGIPVTGEQLLIHRSEKGFSFHIHLKAGEEKAYHIYYRQKVYHHATYILTSTRHWGKPLEKAFYQLKVPTNCIISFFSYPPDYQEENSEWRIFYWYRENFMPDKDFEIKFQ